MLKGYGADAANILAISVAKAMHKNIQSGPILV